MTGQSTTSCPSSSIRRTSSSACARGRVTITRISRTRYEREQLAAERDGIVAGAALDPRAVLVCDERGERLTVVVRGDGSEAAAADRRNARALRLDAPARLRIVGRGDEMLHAGPHLQ